MKSLVRPENDGNVVLSNVLEEEASFDDVDIHEAIEDKTPVAPTVPVVLSTRTWTQSWPSSTAHRCQL